MGACCSKRNLASGARNNPTPRDIAQQPQAAKQCGGIREWNDTPVGGGNSGAPKRFADKDCRSCTISQLPDKTVIEQQQIIEKLFSDYDKSGEGTINHAEAVKMMKDFMKALDHALDNAYNDVLSTAEYAKAPPEQRRALEENFKVMKEEMAESKAEQQRDVDGFILLFDEDRNGQISKEEFSEAAVKAVAQMREHSAETIKTCATTIEHGGMFADVEDRFDGFDWSSPHGDERANDKDLQDLSLDM